MNNAQSQTPAAPILIGNSQPAWVITPKDAAALFDQIEGGFIESSSLTEWFETLTLVRFYDDPVQA